MDSKNLGDKSLDELDVEIDKTAEVIKNKPIDNLVNSAQKLAEQGEKSFKTADYEKAYLLLGRYMLILTTIQKLPTYEKYKDTVKYKLGANKIQLQRMDMLEKSKGKLQTRIVETKQLNKSTKNGEEQKIQAPLKNLIGGSKSGQSESNAVKVSDTISCMELHDLMENDSSKCLIIDCRSNTDFDESRIKFQFIFNIPEHLCILGMSVSKLERQMPNESKVFWNMRLARSVIVFVDWFSTNFVRNSPVWHLRNLMVEYDQDLEKKPEMLLLEGGYDRWLITYPMKCKNPHVNAPRNNANATPTSSIDGIEYPNLEDIVMKVSSDDSISGIPSVDRSTKNKAIKSYEKNLSPSELIEKKEKLLNKSLLNESELMKLEKDYNEMTSNKENEEDASKETEIRYKILELSTQQNDIALENQDIDNELKNVQKNVDQRNISKVEDLEKLLAEEKAKRERAHQEALRLARANRKPIDSEYKPAKTPRKSEIILSPRNLNQNVVPHFDRASKPVFTQVTPQSFYDKQDFAPVYQKVERGLTGLKNLGNTCYMNSILQCLSHTVSLTNFLLENDYEKQINRSNRTKGHIVKTLAAVIKMLWNGECKYISSKYLKSVIGEQENLFCGMDQQDAHEFLIMLIDWLQSDLQTISMPNNVENLPASEKAWLEYTKAKESFILRLFYGQIKSTVKCTQCGEESATFETFSNLSLELPMYNIDRCHITECFNMYFHGEKISGWNCPRCKCARDAIKKLDISKLPPVLVIHLKRFYADSYSFRKKQIYVDFPLANLDMLGYVSPKEKIHVTNHDYNLYAVSNHYGTMESGHYTAFCRNAKQKRWYKFDDHCVAPLDKSDVNSSAAYILFYTNLPDNYYLN